MTGVNCGFYTGWQSKASALGLSYSKGLLKAEALAWVSPSPLRSPWPGEWVLVRIGGLRDAVGYANRSPIWHQVPFHASDLVSQSVKEGDLSRSMGFLGGSDGKESACQAGDSSSIPGLGRSPGEEKWQLTPVFLPGESHGQRSLAGYSPGGHK